MSNGNLDSETIYITDSLSLVLIKLKAGWSWAWERKNGGAPRFSPPMPFQNALDAAWQDLAKIGIWATYADEVGRAWSKLYPANVTR